LAVSRLQRWADTNVTLAFENAQVIPPFSREDTFLGHNLNYLGHIRDISGIYLGYISKHLSLTFLGLSKKILRTFKNFLGIF
jgi:hypothetical protein